MRNTLPGRKAFFFSRAVRAFRAHPRTPRAQGVITEIYVSHFISNLKSIDKKA